MAAATGLARDHVLASAASLVDADDRPADALSNPILALADAGLARSASAAPRARSGNGCAARAANHAGNRGTDPASGRPGFRRQTRRIGRRATHPGNTARARHIRRSADGKTRRDSHPARRKAEIHQKIQGWQQANSETAQAVLERRPSRCLPVNASPGRRQKPGLTTLTGRPHQRISRVKYSSKLGLEIPLIAFI